MPKFEYEGRPIEFVGDYSGSYNCINQGRFYERDFLEQIRDLGLAGTYLDIGTNIGNHALYFSLFCQSDRVIGFEPVKRWRERALTNLHANGQLGKTKVEAFGLSDHSEEIVFKPYETEFRLHCVPLDVIYPDLSGVAFVKMDIEGLEPKALLGGRELFLRNRPVIAAEVLGDTEAIATAAEAIGYHLTGKVFPSTPGSPMYELLPV